MSKELEQVIKHLEKNIKMGAESLNEEYERIGKSIKLLAADYTEADDQLIWRNLEGLYQNFADMLKAYFIHCRFHMKVKEIMNPQISDDKKLKEKLATEFIAELLGKMSKD